MIKGTNRTNKVRLAEPLEKMPSNQASAGSGQTRCKYLTRYNLIPLGEAKLGNHPSENFTQRNLFKFNIICQSLDFKLLTCKFSKLYFWHFTKMLYIYMFIYVWVSPPPTLPSQLRHWRE